MTHPDHEFDDFLARRKPVFSRTAEDPLEPPEELDRIVLRQAREAIEVDRPQRVYKGPRWGAPLALAATLVLALTVILQMGMPAKQPVPEVTVQTVSQRLDYPAAAPAPAVAANNSSARPVAESRAAPAESRAESSFASDAVVVDLATSNDRSAAPAAAAGLVSEEEANRYATTPPPARTPPGTPSTTVTVDGAVVTDVSPPPTEAERAVAKASPAPAFRRDSKTWLAEIDRLRAEGKASQADAELTEYKRQHRAYAVSPDR